MNDIYDIITEAIDGIEEEYTLKAAERFFVAENGSKGNTTINAEDLIEVKNQTERARKASFVAVAAAIVCVVSVAVFFITNNNKVLVRDVMGTEPYSSKITAGVSIQSVTKIDKNTLLAVHNYYIQLIDVNSYKVIKEIPVSAGALTKKIDNGFVIIDVRYENCSFEIFDASGNMTKHVDIPRSASGGSSYNETPVIDPLTICVSADGKSVVYYGDDGFCINSVELDNEIVLQPAEEFSGDIREVNQMTQFILYKDGVIYGKARKVNNANRFDYFFASFDVKTRDWKFYYSLNEKRKLFVQDKFVENTFLTVDAVANPKYAEGKLYYSTIGSAKHKEFICEETYESIRAFISCNASYILTTHQHSMNDAEIKLYDVKTGEVIFTKKTYADARTAYIDENAKKLYFVCGGDLFVLDF